MIQDLFSVLHNEHMTIARILVDMDAASADITRRKELFTQLTVKFFPHAKAEETVFYDGLMNSPATREDAVNGLADHREIKSVFGELTGASLPSPGWMSRFTVLADLIRRHIEKEEAVYFVDAGNHFSHADLEKMLVRYALEEERSRAEFASGQR